MTEHGFLEIERVVDRTEMRERKSQPVYCRVLGCARATRHGKPYCARHVGRHHYVREVVSRLDALRDERARVKRWGQREVDADGITAQDILLQLHVKGPRGVKRLARELGMEGVIVRGYADALVRVGLVCLVPNRRVTHLVLSPAGVARLEENLGSATPSPKVEVAELAVAEAGRKIAS